MVIGSNPISSTIFHRKYIMIAVLVNDVGRHVGDFYLDQTYRILQYQGSLYVFDRTIKDKDMIDRYVQYIQAFPIYIDEKDLAK